MHIFIFYWIYTTTVREDMIDQTLDTDSCRELPADRSAGGPLVRPRPTTISMTHKSQTVPARMPVHGRATPD